MAVYIYLKHLFFQTFGCESSSLKGLMILFALNILFGWLTIHFFQQALKEEDD